MEILNNVEPAHAFEGYKLNVLGKKYRQTGISALKENKVAVVILAGGQGSRLGTDAPKGCYILSIDKSLFELHIENVKNVMRLHDATVHIIIMTSSYTHEMILEYFHINKYFGVDQDLFHFIKQADCMCFDFDDQPLRDDKDEFVMAPNGNGAVFHALNTYKIYEKLPDVEYYNIFSVDNALARIADPVFIGYMIEEGKECASKTVTKLPDEDVGVFIKRGNVLLVKEYSEIKNNIIQERHHEPSGKLVDMSEMSKEELEKSNFTDVSVFDQGNICNHLFTKEFLLKAAHINLPVHKATKKIPIKKGDSYVKPSKENGYKSELFIFDIFEFSNFNGIMNVPRELEFSPVKNGLDSKKDNPTTAVNDLYKRSRIMLECAGVKSDDEKMIIWPSQSVFGENLEDLRGDSNSSDE